MRKIGEQNQQEISGGAIFAYYQCQVCKNPTWRSFNAAGRTDLASIQTRQHLNKYQNHWFKSVFI